jgi:hypothetical protein
VTNQGLCLLHVALSVQSHNAGGCGEALEQRHKPVGAVGAGEAFDLGIVQRPVVSDDPVPSLGLGLLDIASWVFDNSCRSLIPVAGGST